MIAQMVKSRSKATNQGTPVWVTGERIDATRILVDAVRLGDELATTLAQSVIGVGTLPAQPEADPRQPERVGVR